MIDTQNLGISIPPEFINIFKASQSISTVKGKWHYLTRLSKPDKDHIKIQKLDEERKEITYKTKNILKLNYLNLN